MPYALKNPQDGKPCAWRAIDDPEDAQAGEVVVEEIPPVETASLVWDAAREELREATEEEKAAIEAAEPLTFEERIARIEAKLGL